MNIDILNLLNLPGTEEGRERRWWRGTGEEMTQTMYAHVNKLIIIIIKTYVCLHLSLCINQEN
jgi:hypothetical protein